MKERFRPAELFAAVVVGEDDERLTIGRVDSVEDATDARVERFDDLNVVFSGAVKPILGRPGVARPVGAAGAEAETRYRRHR